MGEYDIEPSICVTEFLDQLSDYKLFYSMDRGDTLKTFITTTLQVERDTSLSLIYTEMVIQIATG